MKANWDDRLLMLCAVVAGWSKDPSTQVGSVIVRPNKTIASVGFNGFPRGIKDKPEWLADRKFKHSIIIHAEENAILHAAERLEGYTIYIHPLLPCPRCAAKIIQVGIKRVVAFKSDRKTCGGMDMNLTRKLFKQAGVEFEERTINV